MCFFIRETHPDQAWVVTHVGEASAVCCRQMRAWLEQKAAWLLFWPYHVLDWRRRSDSRKESNAYQSVPKYCFYAQYFHLVLTAGLQLGM